jgi:hypothetical protein
MFHVKQDNAVFGVLWEPLQTRIFVLRQEKRVSTRGSIFNIFDPYMAPPYGQGKKEFGNLFGCSHIYGVSLIRQRPDGLRAFGPHHFIGVVRLALSQVFRKQVRPFPHLVFSLGNRQVGGTKAFGEPLARDSHKKEVGMQAARQTRDYAASVYSVP